MDDFFNFLIAVGIFYLFCGIIFVNNINDKTYSVYDRRIFRKVSIVCAVISIICFTAVYYAPQINSYLLDKSQLSMQKPITHIAKKVKKFLGMKK